MKKVTKLLVLTIALFSLNAAMAQQEAAMQTSKSKVKGVRPQKLTIEQKATKNADSLKVKLNLTDIQYAKVIPINAEFFKNRDALRMKQKTDSTANLTYKADIKALHTTRRTQINAMLTAEQKKIWSALRKQHSKSSTKTGNGNKVKKDDDDIDASEE